MKVHLTQVGSSLKEYYAENYQILRGRLKETLYSWPDKKKIEQGETSPPQVIREAVYEEGQVTYMSDKVRHLPYLVKFAGMLTCRTLTARSPQNFQS